MEFQTLSRRRILLGISGGIAAYKAAELVRLLRQAGAEVQVVMTEAATRFITPLTLQALSGRPVRTGLFDSRAEAAMGHIELARWAEQVVIAPASADFLARLKAGMADDLLATLCLATEAPIAVVPAMNRVMWQHPATRENIAVLRQRGVEVWGPASGGQACGEEGPGRMLEPAEILARLGARRNGALAGRRVLITAGPTREAIDPVRFLSNRSSGKMGYALAWAAREAGAEVVLVSGPVSLTPPAGVEVVAVESAAQMYAQVMAQVTDCDVFIGAAAVADYTPVTAAGQKIKKHRDRLQLELVRTPDILAAVAGHRPRPFTVGFAAETERVREYARDKLARKGLDLIAANPVGPSQGFDRDDNTLWVLWPGGERDLGTASKRELARRLITLIGERYGQENSTENSR
ncbi:phosphopantothenoylcysteine decarboxylase/phosphopantothenate---cysteine ligase [Methylomarinovum caldicuralii]|uniref:Coenzyme A biosynthesis bifunctional protein CoaBC n=1 Tax=Methylomarinovum caldicuralii TaxID=438856 RepID=A0AAU9C1S5_9GAMM|nr:bifunctional phosphopantothenoylcysteine decarboxylase/phosphopantothenate--cysteine ligase CoaBC [Methylomarinovum caldicuralii]BCX82675.1 phosphopantothenoylcysteine decarboxylase/phosphopantothenate---cysteine ligase [Methylomarinovum caldicuralii]